MIKKYCKILNIDSNLNIDVLKKNYRILAKKYHPDSINELSSEEKDKRFKEVSDAYRELSKYLLENCKNERIEINTSISNMENAFKILGIKQTQNVNAIKKFYTSKLASYKVRREDYSEIKEAYLYIIKNISNYNVNENSNRKNSNVDSSTSNTFENFFKF